LWNDRLRLVESVEEQWKGLAPDDRKRVRDALERIDEDPISGAPLFEPLKGYWSYRTARLRIVYRIAAEARFILILSISTAGSAERP
jgi:mRNA-degrading endonuclease RelE of RelBE toxin-antitoxin system